jgi:hypothetical protein
VSCNVGRTKDEAGRYFRMEPPLREGGVMLKKGDRVRVVKTSSMYSDQHSDLGTVKDIVVGRKHPVTVVLDRSNFPIFFDESELSLIEKEEK